MVACAVDEVWRAVADPQRLAGWSPEATRAQVATSGPLAVGARFSGTNQRGGRRWSTSCVVVEATPNEVFAFDVTYLGLRVSRWRYRVSAHAGGCLVVEQWWDRRGRPMKTLSEIGTGVTDRPTHNRKTMQQTLRALKAELEAGTA